MERIAVIFMILAGTVLAGAVGRLLSRLTESKRSTVLAATADLGQVTGSIVFSIARLAGRGSDLEIAEIVERTTGLIGPFEVIDPGVWARSFHRRADRDSCHELLEKAVKACVAVTHVIPLAQYNALLDLSFSLGFRTDALARLRARYRFDYVDYARDRRPEDADRTGRQVFYRSAPLERTRFLEELGLTKMVGRAELISTYRRLATEVHPDRFHDAGAEDREAAADRFIRLTEAFEGLLAEIDWGN